jgi:hypothetical protein
LVALSVVPDDEFCDPFDLDDPPGSRTPPTTPVVASPSPSPAPMRHRAMAQLRPVSIQDIVGNMAGNAEATFMCMEHLRMRRYHTYNMSHNGSCAKAIALFVGYYCLLLIICIIQIKHVVAIVVIKSCLKVVHWQLESVM